MNERQILDIIERELRGKVDLKDRGISDALRRAALLISREADTDRRSAARTASMVGYSVTRGRSHL
jgi:hypothetical protein